ncbi:MAG: C1 family peptidase [Bdellovibrionales bacterium]|nr:C1 family peptidase [Bdellovibrionales bacterium]
MIILPISLAYGNKTELIIDAMSKQLGVSKNKELSPGQRKIQEIKQKNRRLLKSKSDEDQNKGFLETYADKMYQTHKTWKTTNEGLINSWINQRKVFLKNLTQYKKASFNLASELEIKNLKKLRNRLSKEAKHKYYVVKNALEQDIRDQKSRPTCAAFAGVKAIEIMANSNIDLSEQYFYYASKPHCRPCSKRGSWVIKGLNSLKSKGIPTEDQCPYQPSNLEKNQTQTPLPPSCFSGQLRISAYQELITLDDLIAFLESSRPAIGAISLSDHFYKNKGIVKASQDTTKFKDQHTKGHAITFVGYMNIPASLNEGRVCFIVTNSWSEGWGIGGHACLTEKWLLKNRIATPFIGINSVI